MNKAVEDLINGEAVWDADGHEFELATLLDNLGIKRYKDLHDASCEWRWWNWIDNCVHANGNVSGNPSPSKKLYTYDEIMSLESPMAEFFRKANMRK